MLTLFVIEVIFLRLEVKLDLLVFNLSLRKAKMLVKK
jgi:hypothetical protein